MPIWSDEGDRCLPGRASECRVRLKIVDDQPGDALVREAQDADLVVVGGSGLGPVSSVVLGSVTAGVLQRSPCPVVVTPPELRPPTDRVVVGYDGSDVAGRALDWAAEEAGRLGAELVVAQAWKYPHRLTRDGFERSCDIAQLDAALVLEEGVRRARERTSAKVVQELVEGGAAQAMLDASGTADLVVLGSRGRGGFRSMVLGSVTLAVTRHASCPVVVVQ